MDQRGAARRAVVVHVCDRDAREPELVERGLTVSRCSEDVADEGGLDGVIRDPYVQVCGCGCVGDCALYGDRGETDLRRGVPLSQLPGPSVYRFIIGMELWETTILHWSVFGPWAIMTVMDGSVQSWIESK